MHTQSVALLLAVSLLPAITRGPAVAATQDLQTGRPPEDFSAFAGRWKAEAGFLQKEGPRPRYVSLLEITASPTEITINRGNAPVETYRLDGTVSDLGDGLTGSAVLVGDGIALTTRRAREGPRGTITTVHTDLYRVEGKILTLESRLSQTRPDGTVASIPNTRQIIVYLKTR